MRTNRAVDRLGDEIRDCNVICDGSMQCQSIDWLMTDFQLRGLQRCGELRVIQQTFTACVQVDSTVGFNVVGLENFQLRQHNVMRCQFRRIALLPGAKAECGLDGAGSDVGGELALNLPIRSGEVERSGPDRLFISGRVSQRDVSVADGIQGGSVEMYICRQCSFNGQARIDELGYIDEVDLFSVEFKLDRIFLCERPLMQCDAAREINASSRLWN